LPNLVYGQIDHPLFCCFPVAELAERFAVPKDSSNGSFRDVTESFDALAQNLDNLLALNAADGADPEIAARLEKAKALALRGSLRSREDLGQTAEDQTKRFG
jgi:hypothetical protein